MISLFLDTASSNLIVGIYKNLEQLFLKIQKNDNNLSEKVLPLIDFALSSCNLTINDIDNIFVVNGPGSFTGTRIGVTVAKTLAWGLDAKICPISELEVLASSSNKNYIVPMIDARRGYVYAGLYDKSLVPVFGDSYISLEDLYNKIKRHVKISDVQFVSYDSIKDDKITNIIECEIDIKRVISNHINDEDVNPHLVNPLYLKNTEAEEKLGASV